MKLTVLIPVFNEKDTIAKVIEKVNSLPIEKEIIVVDDASTDGTKGILNELKNNYDEKYFKVIFHEKNCGKGKALQTGINYCCGDAICVQDADLEYNPEEIITLFEEFKKNEFDAVFGSRFLKKNPMLYYRYYAGNKFVTFIINLFYSSRYTDSYTCYKLIKKSVFDKLNLKSKRFEIEAEICIKLAKLKVKIKEIPISYTPRKIEEGKKIGFIDGLKAILMVLKLKFLKI